MYSRNNNYYKIPEKFLTPIQSQREDWYVISNYIAEFWCTISNIPLLIIGLLYYNYYILFTSICSIFSHSIPHIYLLYFDKFGVIISIYELINVYNYKSIYFIIPLFIVNLIDTYLSRKKIIKYFHILWHFFAALITLIAIRLSN